MKTMTEREPQLQVASQLGALISEAASRPEVPSSPRTTLETTLGQMAPPKSEH